MGRVDVLRGSVEQPKARPVESGQRVPCLERTNTPYRLSSNTVLSIALETAE